MIRGAALLIALLGACAARAEEAPSLPPPPPPPPEGCLAAEAPFQEGVAKMKQGDDAAAALLLHRAVELCPNHPQAGLLESIVRGHLDRPSPFVEALTGLGDEHPTTFARYELVGGQFLHGFAQGLMFCGATGCNNGTPLPEVGFLGGVVGGGVSFALSWGGGIRPGQALAINAGSLWGAVEGVYLSMAINPNANVSPVSMLLMALGTGAGVLVAELWQPRAGRVAMMDSVVLWSELLTLVALLSATTSGRDIGIGELVAINVSLVGGALLGSVFPMSRGRLFLIDGGGILGLLIGYGAAAFLVSNAPSRASTQVLAGALAIGWTVAGLGTVAYLTQGFDAPKAPPGVAIVPGAAGRPGLSVVGAF